MDSPKCGIDSYMTSHDYTRLHPNIAPRKYTNIRKWLDHGTNFDMSAITLKNTYIHTHTLSYRRDCTTGVD